MSQVLLPHVGGGLFWELAILGKDSRKCPVRWSELAPCIKLGSQRSRSKSQIERYFDRNDRHMEQTNYIDIKLTACTDAEEVLIRDLSLRASQYCMQVCKNLNEGSQFVNEYRMHPAKMSNITHKYVQLVRVIIENLEN